MEYPKIIIIILFAFIVVIGATIAVLLRGDVQPEEELGVERCAQLSALPLSCELSYNLIHVNVAINTSSKLGGLKFFFGSRDGTSIVTERLDEIESSTGRSYYFTDPRAANISSVKLALFTNDGLCGVSRETFCTSNTQLRTNRSANGTIVRRTGGGSGGGGGPPGGGGGSEAPVASFSVLHVVEPGASGPFPVKFIFDARDSHDNDGSITHYAWDFNDNNPGISNSTAVIVSRYFNEGSYSITLTVTDNEGATDEETFVLGVGPPVCGNAWTEFGEQCDDANVYDGDGCSSLCVIEPGYTCSGQPSLCIELGGAIGFWEKMNDGNQVNGDRDVAFLSFSSNNELRTILDGSKLIYFFKDSDTSSLYAGRFDLIPKRWEILGFSGWTQEPMAIPKPLSESHWRIDSLRLFNDPSQSGSFVGIFAAMPRVPQWYFDVHGSVYGIRFENTLLKTWTAADGFTQNNAQALGYNFARIFGSHYDADFADDSGMVVNLVDNNGGLGLSASIYNSSGQFWQTWSAQQNRWVATPLTMGRFSELQLPFVESGIDADNPAVIHVPGTSDFIVTYTSDDNRSDSMRVFKAARYNGQSQSWSWWNNGWVTSGSSGNISTAPLGVLSSSRRPSYFIGDNLYMFFDDAGNSSLYIYNNTDFSWTLQSFRIPTQDYVSAKDSSDNLWIVYSDGVTLNLTKLVDGQWSVPMIVYQNITNAVVPVGLSIVDGAPFLFVVESPTISGPFPWYHGAFPGKLYLLSDPFLPMWGGEQPRGPTQPPPLMIPRLAVSDGREISRWSTNVRSNITYPDGRNYSFSSAYGPKPCAHLALDSDGYIYCPEIIVAAVSIFPPNYTYDADAQFTNSSQWGDFWDYFAFPSSVAISSLRREVFITHNLIGDSGGNVLPIGQIQIWNQSMRNVSVVSNWRYPRTYSPLYISEAEPGRKLNWPSDLAIDEGREILYVSESLSHRILKYNLSMQFTPPRYMGSFGSFGDGQGQFNFPEGIDTDSQGNVYVVDTNNHRIQKFDPEGNFIASWGSLGYGEGQFYYPYAISVDKLRGYVYVTDPYTPRIQIFTQDGSFVRSFAAWDSSTVDNADSFGKILGVLAQDNTLYVGTQITSFSDGYMFNGVVRFQMNLL